LIFGDATGEESGKKKSEEKFHDGFDIRGITSRPPHQPATTDRIPFAG
jgi:hypothetical protein